MDKLKKQIFFDVVRFVIRYVLPFVLGLIEGNSHVVEETLLSFI